MASKVFNIAKGRLARYCDLPETSDRLVWVLLQSTGIEADSVLEDYATLSALLAASNDEATFTGYARQAAASVVVTTDNSGNQVLVDAADVSWSPSGTSQALKRIVLCYDPTGSSPDSALVPLFLDVFDMSTPAAGAITYQVATGGFFTAA